MKSFATPTTSRRDMECTSCEGVGNINLTHRGFKYNVICKLCDGDKIMKICDKCGLNIGCKKHGEKYVCKNCYYGRLGKGT